MRNVVGLLDALRMTSEPAGRSFTQEQVKALQVELMQSGWVREKVGSPGYFTLNDPFRAQTYGVLLDRFALADLRRALHQQVGLKAQSSVYDYRWNIWDSGVNAAVFRLELFGGADAAEIDFLRNRIANPRTCRSGGFSITSGSTRSRRTYSPPVGHPCGMSVVMRRWMTGRKTSRKSSRIGKLTGMGRRNRHRTMRPISASVGDRAKQRFRRAAGSGCESGRPKADCDQSSRQLTAN